MPTSNSFSLGDAFGARSPSYPLSGGDKYLATLSVRFEPWSAQRAIGAGYFVLDALGDNRLAAQRNSNLQATKRP